MSAELRTVMLLNFMGVQKSSATSCNNFCYLCLPRVYSVYVGI